MARHRGLAAALALVALGLFETAAPRLPDPGTAGQVAGVALISLPLATIAITLLADPPPGRTTLGIAIVAGIALSVALIHAGYPITPASVTKLVAAGGIGLLAGSYVASSLELLLVAAVIAVVDIVSVADGPTHEIVAHHPSTLDALTLNLHPLGGDGVAQIGCSDLVFFALFTAAAVSLGLRRWATWAAMTASFGLTLALAFWLDIALPALPLLSVAVVSVNADRLRPAQAGGADSPKRE